MYYMTMSIFDHTHHKIIKITFSFPEFPTARKKLVHSINLFLMYSQFYSPVTRLATSILDHTHLKKFWSTYVNLYQDAKNQSILSIYSGDTWLIKKFGNLIGWEHFGPYVRNKKFSQAWKICAGAQPMI